VVKKNLIITIDGPSGAGKSTIAKLLARALNYRYIDTGAMYRAIAYAYMEEHGLWNTKQSAVKNLNEMDIEEKALKDFLEKLSLRFEFGNETKIYCRGDDISLKIRSQHVSMVASRLSQKKIVREHLIAMQRELGRDGGVVLEGRDTGSVVFPHAHVKFYLDAHVDERAQRRYRELSLQGAQDNLEKIKEEIITRDTQDSTRDLSPLIIPEGARYIDTTRMAIHEVLETLLAHLTEGT